MPWQETSPVDQRERFIHDHRRDLYTMADLCARYDVSRKTGYKWRDRFEEEGRQGLRDRSRAPHQCPHRITPEVAAVICAARRQHPNWGPAKLLAWLRPRQPALDWPAVSTAGDLLARRGLVKKRRRRRHYQHPGVVSPTTTQPNDLWTADFKGHFRTDPRWHLLPPPDHRRPAHPLPPGVPPALDQRPRRAPRLRSAVPRVRIAARHPHRQWRVRFATTGIHGLSQLNVWWLRLGIQHQRILPAQPQQNSAHERMHKTLKGVLSTDENVEQCCLDVFGGSQRVC